jgi:hypothetical protein
VEITATALKRLFKNLLIGVNKAAKSKSDDVIVEELDLQEFNGFRIIR